VSFLGIGSGQHPIASFVNTAGSQLTNLVGTALNGATGVLNSSGGQLFAGTIGTALGGQQANGAAYSAVNSNNGMNTAGKAKNPVTTGEGYTVPLKTNWFTEFHKVVTKSDGKYYLLDADGYPQIDVMKILLTLGIILLIILIIWLFTRKPKASRAMRSSGRRFKMKRRR